MLSLYSTIKYVILFLFMVVKAIVTLFTYLARHLANINSILS